jgi:uncharacterized protein YecE (DUF72 family)
LAKWAEQCKEWRRSHKEVFVYFDNDQEGYAAENAALLLQLLAEKG